MLITTVSAWKIVESISLNRLLSALEQRFIQSLAKFDAFLKTKLDDETSARLFIDSNKMTLSDCNLLPKLHIALTAAKERRDFELPPVWP